MKIGLITAATYLLAAASSGAQSGSEPTVFVYGAAVIDLDRKVERFGSFTGISDCSTESLNCLRGYVLALATPKACQEYALGARWTAGDVTTAVLRIDDTLAAKSRVFHEGMQPVYLLGDPNRPYIVYVISSGSLHGFYYDVRRQSDLVSIARDRGAAELDAAVARRQALFWPLVTFDAWGGCS